VKQSAMKQMGLALALAAAALAGCRAQEGVPGTTPGPAPTAVPDAVVVELDSANNSIAALLNDIDLSGTGLTITGVLVDQTLPATPGAVATTNGSAVTFTPPAGFIGVVTLQYGIIDGTGAVSSALIAVSVLPIAPPPVALPDAQTVLPDSGATDVDVLANDIDLAGGGLTLTGATVTTSVPAAVHTVAVVANQVRFTPAAGFVGVAVVTYTVEDANAATADGVLTVVVSPLALPAGPVPVPDAEVVAQDSGATDIDVLANDVDPVGGGLTVSNPHVTTSEQDAVHTLPVVGNQVRFTPAAGFVGTVVVTYTATDDDGNDADGVLTVVVSPLALAVGPVPVPDAQVVMQDSLATDIDVLANDIDPDGGGLTLGGFTVTGSVPAAAHTVTIVADQIRFTPEAGFAGTVAISYTATDADGDDATGVLTVVVSPLALPVGLVAIPDQATVAQDSAAADHDVLANDVDFAGGGLTLNNASVFSSQPAAVHAVSIVADQVRFTPAAAFAGIVVVSYTAEDVNGVTSNGLLTITVTPSALEIDPLALPDAGVASLVGGAQLFDVVANDINPAGGALTLTDASITAGLGTVQIVTNQVEFTPAGLGVVVIDYEITDVNGNTSTGTLTLVVGP
jgi:hypothetical protein